MILDTLDVDAAAFEAGTGWAVKPEGACKGEVCVPLPDGFALRDAADRLGMPIVADEPRGRWALGPETLSGRALATATAPDLTLPDLDGTPFALSGLRGQKVCLLAWAPY